MRVALGRARGQQQQQEQESTPVLGAYDVPAAYDCAARVAATAACRSTRNSYIVCVQELSRVTRSASPATSRRARCCAQRWASACRSGSEARPGVERAAGLNEVGTSGPGNERGRHSAWRAVRRHAGALPVTEHRAFALQRVRAPARQGVAERVRFCGVLRRVMQVRRLSSGGQKHTGAARSAARPQPVSRRRRRPLERRQASGTAQGDGCRVEQRHAGRGAAPHRADAQRGAHAQSHLRRAARRRRHGDAFCSLRPDAEGRFTT